ncbi:MAG: hypothetical protein JWN60_1109 [Acidobacteria bacterium]|jgi:hypothetical protein|nr:hypothetical protein [Acidobacteriota bacterium]
MPFDYITDSVTDLAIIHAINKCDVPSFKEIMENLARDRQFKRETRILFDASLSSVPSQDEAFKFVEAIGRLEIFTAHKMAIVATEFKVYGVYRMIASLANRKKGSNLKVFISVAKAIEWLDSK